MRFEALHQLLKRYAKNSGYKNVGKTMSEKFQMRVALNFIGNTHPLLKNEPVKHYSKSGKLLHIKHYGITLKAKKGIIVAHKVNNQINFGSVEDIFENEHGTLVKLQKLQKGGFNNNLLAYEVNDSDNTVCLKLEEILKCYGHKYKYEEKIYVVFNCLFI